MQFPGVSGRELNGRVEAVDASETTAPRQAGVVIDLAVYAAAAAGRNTLPPR